MRFFDMLDLLGVVGEKQIIFRIKGVEIPRYFHVTEVGAVRKSFVDCGGTRRNTLKCSFQLWVADDSNHRIGSGKMRRILNSAKSLFGDENPEINVEYGPDIISMYEINDCYEDGEFFIFLLEGVRAGCLAPEKCGIDSILTPESIKNQIRGKDGVRVRIISDRSEGSILRRLDADSYEIWSDLDGSVRVLSPKEFTEIRVYGD